MINIPEVKIAETTDWIQIEGAEKIYENMSDILKKFGMEKIDENYYEQDLKTKEFKAEINASRKLDSRTSLRININIYTRDTPKITDKGIIATINLSITSRLNISFPSENLPKFLSKYLVTMWYYFFYIKQWKRWEEFAEETARGILNEIRTTFGLQKAIGKTARTYYKPL